MRSRSTGPAPSGRRPRTGKAAKGQAGALRALERQVARLTTERKAERRRHERELAALRREGDRRLTAMVQEITRLRHHEARVEALSRLVAERDTALAGQAERIERLETLLRKAPQMS